ncbi:MAG: 2-oxoacid:acceptor oxidoreductase subunit alpha [Candidatus Omnitrophica bacterium]|nr:2-oxoacid:acceptor oxidoreductase subunit alpha [Candidatus Omnitrophota bacterium]
MPDVSVLIAGQAGFGIDKSGLIIARIFNQLGYRLYVYRDYPSLIRGGHTFSIIRAAQGKVGTHKDKIDFLLALNQDAVDLHKERLKEGSRIIYDADTVKAQGTGVNAAKIIKEENASEIMRNTCIIGSFCKTAGIDWQILENVLKRNISREIDVNLKVASRGYNAVDKISGIERLKQEPLPVVTGNEAMGLGLISAGLKAYISYPMTPTSPVLHSLAGLSKDFSLKVIHPENEISVILMALGFSYAGERVAVGTSGGGFCLMTEGFSFAGMSELPLVVILGQRPGPSTGLPTYSAQTELNFALSAGQGEFSRLVVAPADAEEAYYWSGACLNMAWKYQTPVIILSDKNMGEGAYSFDINSMPAVKEEGPAYWDGKDAYKRYLNTETGVSPLAFAPLKGNVVKINSYEHDELGITTEEPGLSKTMQDKRLRKGKYLEKELENYPTVNVYGDSGAATAVICWGSNKGVCVEAAKELGMKVIQPAVLWPLPLQKVKDAIGQSKTLICVESNATAQLSGLLMCYGIKTDKQILKYDGRPFSLEELQEQLKDCSSIK